MKGESMNKKGNVRTMNDERMYDYFHNLLENMPVFLKAGKKKEKKGRAWQKSLTSYNFEQIYETRKAIYSEVEVCNELCMMDDILHIFQEYFHIPGIDRLLVNNYGALENDIFLEYDGESGVPKRIREHYKHQYRNVYLGSVLMLDYGFLDAMTKCILQSNTILSSYVKAQTEADEAAVKRVLYQSYFIGAMFHDIGYPLDFFMRKVKQIHKYAPFYKIISSNVKEEFAELRASLAGSLLFELVSGEKIEEKYNRNDHGCLSALSFLLNFYSAGSIFSLDEKERCMVEMAALAIYRHTDKLENDYMVFEEDPLSYLVRLCDDLQEWERFLLLINEKHNYLKCAKCGCIVQSEGRIYECGCGAKYEKITDITNKKVNYISLCNQLQLDYNEEKKELEVYLEFDSYKQIEILLDDYCAVEKRKSDLDKVKKYLQFQKFMPKIRLRENLSNNPVELIEDFLEQKGVSLEEIKEEVEKGGKWNKHGTDKMWDFLKELECYQEKEKKENKFGKRLESDMLVYGRNAVEFVEKNLGQIHSLMKEMCQ